MLILYWHESSKTTSSHSQILYAIQKEFTAVTVLKPDPVILFGKSREISNHSISDNAVDRSRCRFVHEKGVLEYPWSMKAWVSAKSPNFCRGFTFFCNSFWSCPRPIEITWSRLFKSSQSLLNKLLSARKDRHFYWKYVTQYGCWSGLGEKHMRTDLWFQVLIMQSRNSITSLPRDLINYFIEFL